MVFAFLLLAAALLLALLLFVFTARHKKQATRELDLVGRSGTVVSALQPEGAVLVAGELWRARTRSGAAVAAGRVRVVGARGHLLEVEADG